MSTPENQKTISHWRVVQDRIDLIKVNGKPIGYGMTPEDMWNEAVKYFMWCDRNPIYKGEMIRSGRHTGQVFTTPMQRPYTISGLCIHIGVTREYLYDAAKSQEKNEFYFVVTQIMDCIYSQKLEFAIAGVYNPVITARELGLAQTQAGDKGSPLIQITVEGNSPKLLTNESEIEITKEQFPKEQFPKT